MIHAKLQSSSVPLVSALVSEVNTIWLPWIRGVCVGGVCVSFVLCLLCEGR